MNLVIEAEILALLKGLLPAKSFVPIQSNDMMFCYCNILGV